MKKIVKLSSHIIPEYKSTSNTLTFAMEVGCVYIVAPWSPEENAQTPVRSWNALPNVWPPHNATVSRLFNPIR